MRSTNEELLYSSGMTTRITFVSNRGDNPLGITVAQSPEEVLEALTTADGLPFSLDLDGEKGKVFVSPSAIAYWKEHGRGSARAVAF
jgi:hypothetical protein